MWLLSQFPPLVGSENKLMAGTCPLGLVPGAPRGCPARLWDVRKLSHKTLPPTSPLRLGLWQALWYANVINLLTVSQAGEHAINGTLSLQGLWNQRAGAAGSSSWPKEGPCKKEMNCRWDYSLKSVSLASLIWVMEASDITTSWEKLFWLILK